MSTRTRSLDLDWPVSALALVAAILSAYLLSRPVTLRPVGWTAPTAAAGSLSFNVGEVRRRPAGSLVWYPAERGDTVFVGDALFVAARSAATVALEGGGQLDLDQNTLVVVEPPGRERRQDRRVALRKGSLSGTTGTRPLQVEAGGAVAALGPDAQADVAVGGEVAEVAVRRGSVALNDASGARSGNVGASESATINLRGEVARAPGATVALLAPASHHRQLAGAPLAFRWQAAGPDATLELATDRRFTSIVRRAPGAGEAQQTLEPGVYWWRVAGSDGRPLSEARPLTVLANVAPRLLAPTQGETFDGEVLELRWSAVRGATGYEWELARDAGMKDVVSRADVSGTSARPGGIVEGSYWWRARAKVAGSDGAWSPPSPFRVLLTPLPAAPVLRPPEIEVHRGDAGAN